MHWRIIARGQAGLMRRPAGASVPRSGFAGSASHRMCCWITSPAKATAWFRLPKDYTSKLRESNYCIMVLQEPHPSPEQLTTDPWWADNFVRSSN
jgi:hypothetical protein